LKDILGVTVLLTDDAEPPTGRDFDVIRGRIRSASGALGGFELAIDGLSRVIPGGRGAFSMTGPRDGARSECDVILDLSGGPALFPAPEKREGYLRADPGSVQAVAAAVLSASHLVGTFEKPIYVRLVAHLCAHSRAGKVACSNCLDNCPTGAITPDGEHVSIDPMVCAGCGSCAALCPSGAITYDAPATETLFQRIYTLARAYREAGGSAARLLAVDGHGAEMIRLLARFGRGLPADVIPLEVGALNTFGHAEAIAALAAGFASVVLLPGPGTEREALIREVDLARAIAGEDRVGVVDEADPDLMGDALWEAAVPRTVDTPVRPLGTRRQITRQAARALHGPGAVLPLPETAPYGAVLVDTDACTLCLSCVSLCPSGALGDNPDMPQLTFQEDACLQCGLCATICPENAIAYEPRLNLGDDALSHRVLHEEEPFACVECGALFGSRSSIERITERLAGHPMYQAPGALRMLQMCDDCRVRAQFLAQDNPFAAGEPRRPRTTDDYLSKRRDH
jgi:ferredoxin